MFKIDFKKLLFIILFCLLITGEYLSAKLAYETMGEIASKLLLVLILLNFLPLALFIRKKEEISLAILLLFSFIIIPYQVYLGHRLFLQKEEASNIVAYIYQEKIKTGSYPDNISGYIFAFPDLKKYFTYSKTESGDSNVSYYTSDPGTSHFFSTTHGKWSYYPD